MNSNQTHTKKEIALHIQANYFCNNNCIFCMEPETLPDVDLDRNKIFKHLKRCKGKVSRVLFTTKEPTLNPQLAVYVKYAKSFGYEKIAVVSNGRKLSYLPYCLSLIKEGMNMFAISIHGHRARLHDSFTRTPGSFKQTSSGLRNLSDVKKIFPITLCTSTVLTKLSYMYLEDIMRFLFKFNLDSIILNVVQPRGEKMKRHFSSLMPKYSVVAKKIKDLYNKTSFFHSDSTEIKLMGIPACVMGVQMKNLLGCTEFIKKALPSGKTEDIKNIFSRDCNNLKMDDCKYCKFFSICEGVPKLYVDYFGCEEFKPVS